MTLLPKSLLGRHTLLLIVLILIGQLVAGLIFREFVQMPFVARLARTLADDLLAIQSGLAALPAPERQRFVDRFNQQAAPEVAKDSSASLALPAERLLIQQTANRLTERGVQTIWRRETSGALYVRMMIDDQPYWLSTAGIQPTMRLPRAAIVSWLAGILLAILGAWLIQRRINQPLRQLVETSQQIGALLPPQPLPEDGPSEIAKVCHSFNQMQARLIEQDQQRALMLAGVSHDLRTPLTKIRLSAEILAEQCPSELIANIVRHCRHLDGIIQQFVDFAGIGTQEAIEWADANDLIRQLIGEIAAPFTLNLMEPAQLPLRPIALRRVLSNLIENALRYGQPDFCISTRWHDQEFVITIADRGPGIPLAQINTLIQPFIRGNSARNGEPGAGLGLAIATRLLALDQGELHLLPRPGGGLAAEVRLPKRQLSALQPAAIQRKGEGYEPDA